MKSLVTNCLTVYVTFTLTVISVAAQSPPAQSPPAQAPLGQTMPGDSSIRLTEDHAIALYHNYLGEESPIYNGIGHITDDASTRGFAYFQSATTFPGSVVYDGSLYTNLPILYDLVRDQVIVADRNGYLIGLFMPRVREFSLFGHHFINTPRGVYDQLVTGPVMIMARRTKKIEETIVSMEVIHPITAKDYFYAVKDGVYYEVHNQGSLLALMNDRKKEVKAFIKENRIRFRKDPEGATCKIAAYYNQLSGSH
jgi:hypothetical protein